MSKDADAIEVELYEALGVIWRHADKNGINWLWLNFPVDTRKAAIYGAYPSFPNKEPQEMKRDECMSEEMEKDWQEYAKKLAMNPSIEFEEPFKRGWLAHASRTSWVEIGDIPDEWKDGRELDLWGDEEDSSDYFGASRHQGWFESESQQWENRLTVIIPTHAMLPLPSPKVIT